MKLELELDNTRVIIENLTTRTNRYEFATSALIAGKHGQDGGMFDSPLELLVSVRFSFLLISSVFKDAVHPVLPK